ncbi:MULTISPECIES: SGNH/GDSL hydrolase family protein [Streptomyces]|uniref:Secreted hydrolase n=1 Tax=Streptomyces albus (strain ATCC 21838 / DSM 41398 / FERM P-419 / JCM 4703 / NBRC 107858) TaxID=1081613 RepID=A0A0B5EXB0_STRA4|nr:SGNH/GDSL hydrolase family protein [Streptomyces sp. SCSIO ZS0520]AJE83845.1 secreted hydrolase [Streptomyces albus]AOU78150.1 secreted hydrolase [Streptomyces albus]AYN33906.1 SGNH/GDSL hydrolase family protein [Streptomyces albus]
MPVRAQHRVAAAALATAGLAALGLGAPASAQAAEPLDYVALGDSYSAGSGVLPLDPEASLLCARTSKNYPHLLAEATGAKLRDVTCGGATTSHFTESQYPGVAPQFDALKSDTDLVTLTIGGNDNNTFIGAILACGSAGVLSLGQGSPCKDAWGDKFTDDIRNKTLPALQKSLKTIRQKSPHAEVAILGYPWIMPKESVSGCYLKMPIAKGDVPYLRDLQTELNSAVEKAAADNGATYVDLNTASEGHDACAPADKRWIEPVLFGTNFVPVHPNAAGEAAMAAEVKKALGVR